MSEASGSFEGHSEAPTSGAAPLHVGSAGPGGSGADADATTVRPSDAMPARVGPYRVLGVVGSGGFGVVYEAEQVEPVRRRVALKLIKPGMDSAQVVARFEAERQALALMDHRGVARVFDAGVTAEGRPFFAMEFVRGEPITEFCARHRLGVEARVGLMVQVCLAVQHAHMKGVIHRDLKPSNILVEPGDGRPLAKVIDFGVAKALHQPLTGATIYTERGQIIGTPEYMSPEQARGGGMDVDTRADVYSLGAVLYELLAGVPPLDSRALRSGGIGEIPRFIEETEPSKPSTRLLSAYSGGAGGRGGSSGRGKPVAGEAGGEAGAGGVKESHVRAGRSARGPRSAEEARALARLVRGDLDRIVMKCLSKERDRRYAAASALAEDLERFLRSEPVSAGPPGAGYRVRKFVRRHRAAAAGASLVVIALVLGVAGTSYGLAQAAGANRELRGVNAALQSSMDRLDSALETVRSERDRARDAEQRAQRELERANEVKWFLSSMLSAASPAAARGEDTTLMRSILDEAARRIDAGEVGDPLIEGEIRQAIGDTWWALGDLERAERMLEDAVRLRRESLGADDGETLLAMNSLAGVLRERGRAAEAEGMLRRVYEGMVSMFGEEDLDTLAALNNWGAALRSVGRLEEAERAYRRALEGQRRVLGADHPNTLSSAGNLGVLLRSTGRAAEAEPFYKEALEGMARVLGPSHPDTLLATNNMAALQAELGRPDEAERLYREAYGGLVRIAGVDHPMTLTVHHNLGDLLRKSGREAEAEPILREVLEARTRTLGSDHPDSLSTASSLAMALSVRGGFAEAEALLLRVHGAWVRGGEGGLAGAQRAASDLAELYDRWERAEPGGGRGAEAEAWRRRARGS